jgi:DNA polymerase III subunit delta'
VSVASVFDGVIGQDRVVDRLRRMAPDPVHAYLFVGGPGTGKERAARAFAALLLAGVDDPDGRTARLALNGEHPDVVETRRTGASISKDQIDEIIRTASLAPVESARKVMILEEFHVLTAEGAARLLKTIEEPPANRVFIVIADMVHPELITIASRCVRVDFAAIDDETIVAALVADGHAEAPAREAAAAARGDLERARLLVADPNLARRRAAFAAVPSRLTGSGNVVAQLADEIGKLADEAAASLEAVHTAEVAALEARVAQLGERGSGRKALEDQHKREVRRYRTDELRSGLATIAAAYRDALVASPDPHHESRLDRLVAAVDRIHRAIEALDRNPNETLLLQSLLLDLPSLPGR